MANWLCYFASQVLRVSVKTTLYFPGQVMIIISTKMVACIDLLQLHYYQLKQVGGASVDNLDRDRIRASLLIIIMNDSNINL